MLIQRINPFVSSPLCFHPQLLRMESPKWGTKAADPPMFLFPVTELSLGITTFFQHPSVYIVYIYSLACAVQASKPQALKWTHDVTCCPSKNICYTCICKTNVSDMLLFFNVTLQKAPASSPLLKTIQISKHSQDKRTKAVSSFTIRITVSVKMHRGLQVPTLVYRVNDLRSYKSGLSLWFRIPLWAVDEKTVTQRQINVILHRETYVCLEDSNSRSQQTHRLLSDLFNSGFFSSLLLNRRSNLGWSSGRSQCVVETSATIRLNHSKVFGG